MGNKLTGMNWLKEWIGKLEITNSRFKEEINRINNLKLKTCNEFREWTPLKLILLNYALDVCTPIIKNYQHIFKKMYYVDLFAGSGINKIKNSKDFLIGSPLIALLNYSDSYTSMIFCEKQKECYESLKLRINSLGKNNIIINKEYESYFENLIGALKENNIYSFFFIDPNCMEFKWNFMEEVLSLRSDIIFTFMTSNIWRAVGLANADIGQGDELTNLFGDESWKNAKTSDELVEIYKQKILGGRKEAPIRIIKIKSDQFGFYYHLFFITNKTSGENKWLRAIDKAKEEIESNSDVAVIKALDIIKKRQMTLGDF